MNKLVQPIKSNAASGINFWLMWSGVAVLAAPVAIVLHEIGHFVVAEAFGFPDVVLHYTFVSDGAEEAGFPAWQRGVKAIAGPVVTLVLVLGSVAVMRKIGPHPLAVAPAFAAGVRAVILGGAYLLVRILHPERAYDGNFDELNAARHLDLSPDFVMGVSVIAILGTWIYVARHIPAPIRWKALAAITLGTIVGIATWVSFVGPMLLP